MYYDKTLQSNVNATFHYLKIVISIKWNVKTHSDCPCQLFHLLNEAENENPSFSSSSVPGTIINL